VSQIVEAYLWEPGFLEERFEGSLHEILRVDGRADVSSKDKTAVFVESRKLYPFF
jgi:hypothetical protein